jgi:hypothetical protein
VSHWIFEEEFNLGVPINTEHVYTFSAKAELPTMYPAHILFSFINGAEKQWNFENDSQLKDRYKRVLAELQTKGDNSE